MPDLLLGKCADITWYPPNTEEKKAKMKDVFARGSPGVMGARIAEWMQEVHGENEKWGIVGLCWGGKVVAVVTGAEESKFVCGAMAHPAMVDPADATKISIPFAVLPSMDEDAEVIQTFSEALKGKKVVETFGDQIHGWMGARGDLKDARCREEYERGYKLLVDFFGENLG